MGDPAVVAEDTAGSASPWPALAPHAHAPHGRARGELLLVGAIFAVLALVLTYPVVANLASRIPGDLGDPVLNAWILSWVSDRLAHAGAGLWSPPIFHPYPLTLAYSENLLGIAPFVAPLYWLTHDAVLVYDVAFLGSYVLAGLGVYVLMRELAVERAGAWLGALAFAFGPYRAAQMVHLQMLMTGWMPLCLAALHRYASTGSRRALTAFVLAYAVQVLSNGYMLYFLALPVAVVAIGHALRRERTMRRLTELASAAAAIAALLAPVLWLYYRVRLTQGLVRGTDEIRGFGADLGGFLHAADGIVSARWFPGFAKAEGELFPGLVTLLLAVVAWATWRRAPGGETHAAPARTLATGLYTLVTVCAFVLSFGVQPTAWGHPFLPTAPYAWLLRVIPGLDGLRVPARLNGVTVLGLAVLAGIGGGWLNARAPRRWRPVLLVVLGAALVLEGYPGAIPTEGLSLIEKRRDDPINEWLARAPEGAVLQLPFSDTTSRTVLVDLAYQWAALAHRHPIVNGYSGYGSPLARFLGGQGSPLREPALTSEWLRLMRSIGVRYVVARNQPPYRETPAKPSRALTAIRAAAAEGEREERIGGASVFTLTAGSPETPPDPRAAIPRDAFAVEVSRAAARLGFLTDGDRGSRWLTPPPQSGQDWLDVRLREPRSVAGLELDLEPRSVGEYPRELRIRSVGPGGSDEVVYRGGVVAALGRSLIASPARPTIRIDWEPRVAHEIRIESVGEAPCCGWSVHELWLLEPR